MAAMQAPSADVVRAIGDGLYVTKSFNDTNRVITMIRDEYNNSEAAQKVWSASRTEEQLCQVSTAAATPQQQE
jgi:prefoldin subunit 5